MGNKYIYDSKAEQTRIKVAAPRKLGADWLPLNINFALTPQGVLRDSGLKEHIYAAVFGHITPRLKHVEIVVEHKLQQVTITGKLHPLGDEKDSEFLDLFDFDPHPTGTLGQRSNNAESAVVFVNRNALPGSTDFRILAQPEHYPTIQKSYPFERFE